MNTPADLSPLLEAFFTQRLMAQRKVSAHTISSYRDTFRLLLKFAERRLKRPPSKLTLENLNGPFLAEFLDHLEAERTNGPRTRNLRLAAIHSFFRYAALEAPQHAGLIQRVLAYPTQTALPSFSQLLNPFGDRGPSFSGRSSQLDWSTRSCLLANGASDGSAALRAD